MEGEGTWGVYIVREREREREYNIVAEREEDRGWCILDCWLLVVLMDLTFPPSGKFVRKFD